MKLDQNDAIAVKRAEAAVQDEIDGERLILIAWAKSATARKSYECDAFRRDAKLASKPLTRRYLNDDGSVKIKTIIDTRCVRCHSSDVAGAGAALSLETYDDIAKYTKPEKLAIGTKP